MTKRPEKWDLNDPKCLEWMADELEALARYGLKSGLKLGGENQIKEAMAVAWDIKVMARGGASF